MVWIVAFKRIPPSAPLSLFSDSFQIEHPFWWILVDFNVDGPSCIEKRLGENQEEIDPKRVEQQQTHIFDLDTLRHFYGIHSYWIWWKSGSFQPRRSWSGSPIRMEMDPTNVWVWPSVSCRLLSKTIFLFDIRDFGMQYYFAQQV